jgi:hypothetical protein
MIFMAAFCISAVRQYLMLGFESIGGTLAFWVYPFAMWVGFWPITTIVVLGCLPLIVWTAMGRSQIRWGLIGFCVIATWWIVANEFLIALETSLDVF